MTAMALEDTTWTEDALDAIRVLASIGEPFSADDLRELHRPAPEGSMVGAVFKEARRLRIIRKHRPICSTAASRNGALIWQWVGVTE
jgi:hypothetical protein